MFTEKIIKKITPTEKEKKHIQRTVTELIELCENTISKLQVDAEPMLVGSVAKDTYLKKPDIDIFILFPMDINRENLERYGLKIGESVIPHPIKKYAEHPYTSGIFRGYEVDIVPCYKISKSNEMRSAVDRTPLHTRFVIENLDKNQKNDVRLLKQFLKGIGIYGAEAKIEGFSGYLTELLVLYYDNFMSVISNAKKWKYNHYIALDKKKYKKSFPDAPLTVIDPVDSNRNVASALTIQNFAQFIHACAEYSLSPSENFFFPRMRKTYTKKKICQIIKSRETEILGIEISKPELVDDILYPQLRKCIKAIRNLCIQYHFQVINSNFYIDDNILFLFEFCNTVLPRVKKHYGPYVWSEHSKRFIEKWKNQKNTFTKPYIENGRWVIETENLYTDVVTLIKTKAHTLNLGKDIKNTFAKSMKILTINEIIDKYSKAVTQFFDKGFRWQTREKNGSI